MVKVDGRLLVRVQNTLFVYRWVSNRRNVRFCIGAERHDRYARDLPATDGASRGESWTDF